MILLFLSSTYFLEEENSVTKPQYNYKHRGDSTLVQSQSLIHTAHSNFTSCSNNVFITFFFFITVQDVMQIYAFHFTVIYIFSVLYFGVVLQPFFIFYDLDIFLKSPGQFFCSTSPMWVMLLLPSPVTEQMLCSQYITSKET